MINTIQGSLQPPNMAPYKPLYMATNMFITYIVLVFVMKVFVGESQCPSSGWEIPYLEGKENFIDENEKVV